MYVTLEPCIMCVGALYLSQIERLVFAASDVKGGLSRGVKLHPKTRVTSGIMKEESERILVAMRIRDLNEHRLRMEKEIKNPNPLTAPLFLTCRQFSDLKSVRSFIW
mgnify:CR=1 FL=1